jgi:hypothetical protein
VVLVKLDDFLELSRHKGSFAILRTMYGSDSFAWGQPEGVVEVHVMEALPEDFYFHTIPPDFRFRRGNPRELPNPSDYLNRWSFRRQSVILQTETDLLAADRTCAHLLSDLP